MRLLPEGGTLPLGLVRLSNGSAYNPTAKPSANLNFGAYDSLGSWLPSGLAATVTAAANQAARVCPRVNASTTWQFDADCATATAFVCKRLADMPVRRPAAAVAAAAVAAAAAAKTGVSVAANYQPSRGPLPHPLAGLVGGSAPLLAYGPPGGGTFSQVAAMCAFAGGALAPLPSFAAAEDLGRLLVGPLPHTPHAGTPRPPIHCNTSSQALGYHL